jgi:NADPH2:quinone reductase
VRAIVVTRSGGPEVLELQDLGAPEPGPGELLVDVAVAGVNFRDIYERRGGYGAATPLVAGIEGMGRVAALGEGVTEAAVGDRVAWNNAQGSYAEQVVLPAARAVPVPDGIGDKLACAALLQGMTAHYLTHSTYPVQSADEVLVHAAAGGAGRLVLQMAKLCGGRVTATTSGGEKAELARSAGADEVIGYDDVPEGRFAVVYDGVGKATFDRSLAALRPRGMLVLFGAASGPVPPFEIMRLLLGLDVPDPADARPLRRKSQRAAQACRRRVFLDRRRVTGRPHRRDPTARGGASRPGGPRVAPDDRQASAQRRLELTAPDPLFGLRHRLS